MKNVPFVLAICIATLTASGSARAETIYIKCVSGDLYTVDLTNKTVDNHPANITPLSINWDRHNGALVAHHHIDRTAGTLTVAYENNGQGQGASRPSACKTVKKPATKF